MKKGRAITKQPEVETMNKINFNTEQIGLIKKTMAPGATDDELKLFLYQSQRTGLDPLARQIYFIKRGGKVTMQTSIDGFRVIADRAGDYAGQDEPEFFYPEGSETKKIPTKCVVRVYKFSPQGQRYQAAVGVAFWTEYKPDQAFMWNKMPHTMLAKVAEALALRKAFPQDLSGLYVEEEMDQAVEKKVLVPTEEVTPAPNKVVKAKTVDEVLDKAAENAGIVDQTKEEKLRLARIDFIKKLIAAKKLVLEGADVDTLTLEQTEKIKNDYLKSINK